MRVVWDPHKAATNSRKHRVTFAEAATVFADPLASITQDAIHPERALIVGRSEQQRLLVTVFIELDGEELRIISSRRATSHERRFYETGEEE